MDSPDHPIQVSCYLNPFCKSCLVQKGQENICMVYLHMTHATKCFTKLHSPLWPKVPESQLFPLNINTHIRDFVLFLCYTWQQTMAQTIKKIKRKDNGGWQSKGSLRNPSDPSNTLQWWAKHWSQVLDWVHQQHLFEGSVANLLGRTIKKKTKKNRNPISMLNEVSFFRQCCIWKYMLSHHILLYNTYYLTRL